ncbi:MAG: NAD-dependent epimerase/dehydratase family protein [Oscillospiraceae bacterium]|nr:NAD-dependent epimerase/dehydratase family protein [Oscillospiraceae bacterium]
MTGTSVITGATGHIGYALVQELLNRGERLRLLLRKPSPLFNAPDLEIVQGDITAPATLREAFAGAETVYHLAGLIEVGSDNDNEVWHVNVDGTQNVIAACKACGVRRLVYCSSVDALPPAADGVVMTEIENFQCNSVNGTYAKTKAVATQAVLNSACEGFDVVVGHPSACIGPYDFKQSNIGEMVRMFMRFKFPVTMRFGGYNFVDVRDVAQGLAACGERALAPSGSCYLLTGNYHTTGEFIAMLAELNGYDAPSIALPRTLAEASAPIAERYYKIFDKTPLFTRYSLRKIMENGLFSYEKATQELGYCPRSAQESLRDMIAWIHKNEEEIAA